MTEPEPWTEIEDLLETRSTDELKRALDALSPSDVALSVSHLDEAGRTELVTLLAPEDSASLVERLPLVQAVQVVETLPPEVAAGIIDNLPSDEQADLLGDLPTEDATAILSHMSPKEAVDARALSQYSDDVAGGLMVTEFLKYPERYHVADVVDDMRRHAADYRDYDVQYAYVTDDANRLTGVLRLRDLLLARDTEAIDRLMIRDPLSVKDEATIDELDELFRRHTYIGVPVTDASGVMLGVVRRDAVDEAVGERQESDYLKAQGIVGGEEIRSMPLLRRASQRLKWLSANIGLNICAVVVIAFFEDTLAAVIGLTKFLPIISDMSGCSGNQAVAVSMRELSMGLVRPQEVFRVWSKEITVGCLNGTVLGILIGGVATVWQGMNPYFGLVVGLALCLNTLLSVSLGGIVPLLLKRMNVDPAIASGPLLTTVTDMCGFFMALGFATALLPYLQ